MTSSEKFLAQVFLPPNLEDDDLNSAVKGSEEEGLFDTDVSDLLRDNFGSEMSAILPDIENYEQENYDIDGSLAEILEDLQGMTAMGNEVNNNHGSIADENSVGAAMENVNNDPTKTLIEIQKEIEYEIELARVEKLRKPTFQTLPAYQKRAKQEAQWSAVLNEAKRAHSLLGQEDILSQPAKPPVRLETNTDHSYHYQSKAPIPLDLQTFDIQETAGIGSYPPSKQEDVKSSWSDTKLPTLNTYQPPRLSNRPDSFKTSLMVNCKNKLSASNHFPANSRIFNRSLQELQHQAEAISSKFKADNDVQVPILDEQGAGSIPNSKETKGPVQQVSGYPRISLTSPVPKVSCRKPIVPLDRSSRPAVTLLSPTGRASVQSGPAFTLPTPSPSVQRTAAQHAAYIPPSLAAQHAAYIPPSSAAQHAAYIPPSPAPSPNFVPHQLQQPGSLSRAGRQVSYQTAGLAGQLSVLQNTANIVLPSNKGILSVSNRTSCTTSSYQVRTTNNYPARTADVTRRKVAPLRPKVDPSQLKARPRHIPVPVVPAQLPAQFNSTLVSQLRARASARSGPAYLAPKPNSTASVQWSAGRQATTRPVILKKASPLLTQVSSSSRVVSESRAGVPGCLNCTLLSRQQQQVEQLCQECGAVVPRVRQSVIRGEPGPAPPRPRHRQILPSSYILIE